METYDYVVIGGGSAGCIVAARLASESDARVLLLECGDGQSEGVAELLRERGWSRVATFDDLSGRARAVEARRTAMR